MPSIKEYNVKLKSLRNTQKITKTMKMVSASKLRKAQEAQVNAKLYAQKITELSARISNGVHQDMHPLLEEREETKNVHILIVTSDKGLCGAFNNNANKTVSNWLNENRDHEKIDISCCGKRGFMFFNKHDIVKNHYENVTISPKFSDAKKIGDDLMQGFIDGTYDEVYMTYNQFFSPLSQKTIFEKILPLDTEKLVKEGTHSTATDYILEPVADELLDYLIPHYIYFKVYFSLLENSAGEHGARMTAMDSATKNASELIDKNTLLRNRARQAQITTELTEIVAGAEAL